MASQPQPIQGIIADKLYPGYLKSRHVTIDSREVRPGSIFFGIKGDHADGNDFAAHALNQGAAWVVYDKPELAVQSEKLILTHDSLAALQGLASYHRKHINIPVIAITGSNGKTTTKELITAVLSQAMVVGSTKGNLNNHLGVPLTLLNQGKNMECLIVEMGANHPEEIACLCHIAKPTHGLITNIGRAHLEGFGGLEGVIRAKRELYQYLSENQGIAFVNADDELLMDLSMSQTRMLYGNHKDSLVSITSLEKGYFLGMEYKLSGQDETHHIQTKLSGDYNAQNILAALCLGKYFGVPCQNMAMAISSYDPVNNRSQVVRTQTNTLISDLYNANPSSMEAAIKHFSQLDATNKMLILGDMLELGVESEREHKEIIQLLSKLGLEKVLLVGPAFSKAAQDTGIKTFISSDVCRKWLDDDKIRDHLILIKGSRGIRMEEVIPAL